MLLAINTNWYTEHGPSEKKHLADDIAIIIIAIILNIATISSCSNTPNCMLSAAARGMTVFR